MLQEQSVVAAAAPYVVPRHEGLADPPIRRQDPPLLLAEAGVAEEEEKGLRVIRRVQDGRGGVRGNRDVRCSDSPA